MYRMLAVLPLACALACCADAQPQAAFPLWDGKESIEQYAKRVNLPPTRTLDLGNGASLELVLIPAGKFIMGTPEPKPVDEEKAIEGMGICAAGIAVLLVLIATVIVRAVRQRRRPQYSLARFLVMIVAAGVAVMGGTHYWHSTQPLRKAEYRAAFARYQISCDSEKPGHQVTLTAPFHIGRCEVTQEQYEQVMGTNPSHFKGASLPVETVSWDDATAFCKKVSEKTSQTVQLPTEAQWEYACRAGTATRYYTGDDEADLGRAAWYGANSGGKTHPVGQKEPNAFGVYDMHGNVWEWPRDWYERYKPEAAADPQGPPEGAGRLPRGGSWLGHSWRCRSGCRYGELPDERDDHFGFRVVVLAPGTP